MTIKNEKKYALIKIDDFDSPYYRTHNIIPKPQFPVFTRPLIDYAIDTVLHFGNVEKIFFLCHQPESYYYIRDRDRLNKTDVEFVPEISSRECFSLTMFKSFPERFKEHSVVYLEANSLLFGGLSAVTELSKDNFDSVFYTCGKKPLRLLYLRQNAIKEIIKVLKKGKVFDLDIELVLLGLLKKPEFDINTIGKDITSSVFRYDLSYIEDVAEASHILSIYTKSGRKVADIENTIKTN